MEKNDIRAVADLPKDRIRLTAVVLPKTGVNNEDLRPLEKCKELEHLELNDNPLVDDDGLKFFDGIKTLTYLGLDNTKVTNRGLAYFKDCIKLQDLHLFPSMATRKQVTHTGLDNFAKCKNLRIVQIGATSVSEDDLRMLGACPKLLELSIGETDVENRWLEHLFTCKNLAKIDLTNTPKITRPGVERLHKALPNCKIKWPTGNMIYNGS